MKKGIKSWVLIIPIILITFSIQIGLIINSSVISKYSNRLSDTMTNAADNVNDITSLQGGSSSLSETATAFVYIPYIEETGEVNIAPLLGYISEYKAKRRPSDILPKLKANNLDTELYDIVSGVADKINQMMDVQAHAIALTLSVYKVENEQINVIPKYTLTAEELSMSDQERLDKALGLLLASDYSLYKRDISASLSAAVSRVKAMAAEEEAKLNKDISFFKGLNWGFTALIAMFLFSFFAVIIIFVIIPIVKYKNNIENDEKLPIKGLYETRVFAQSYNNLFEKKQLFEKRLKESIETDALTGLKSRYALNTIFQQEVGPTSICLFVFDVNNLKTVNDGLGHDAGDELIIRASNAILKTFNYNDSFLAYRFGGDEFVVIIKDINEKDIEKLMTSFSQVQKEEELSIACGYVYEKDGSNTSYSQLFKRADRKMYDNKEENKQK